jgi:CheY-like chemotaxis protein
MSGTSDKKPLGRILLQQKLVTPGELDQLLEKQRRSPGTRLASAAAASGKLDDLDLLRALSEQLGVPAIDLSQVVVPLGNLKLVPLDVAKQYLILPFSVKDNEMWLAMADPHDRRVIDEIEFVTGKNVSPYVALHEHLARVVEDAYRELERGEAYYVGPNAPQEYLATLGIASKAAPPAAPPAPARPPPREPAPAAREDRFGPRGPTVHQLTDEADFSGLLSEPARPIPAAARAPMREPAPPPREPTGLREPPAPPRTPTGLREAVAARVPTGLRDPGPPHPSLRPDISALDPAFDSRVGPLPRNDSRDPNAARATRTVLVVDDEEDIRRMLRRVLQERGYRVVEAARGTEALQAVRDHVLDCILLDAMLPEIHGFDICRRIKSSQKYGHIPIIMVSAIYRGWRFAEDLRESYGVTAFLEKPFKISDVIVAVERAIEGKPFETADQEDEALGAEAQASLTRGMDAYHRGDLDTAIGDLKQGLALEPNSFRLHYHLGLLYGRRDNVFEAIQEMETALGISSRNFAALKNLAVLYQRAGFKHKAVESWERALRCAPDEETRRGIKEHLMSLL